MISLHAFFSVVGMFLFVVSEVVHADNSSTEQTIYLQQLFGANANYRQANYGRLRHNNGEAIYISLEKNSFSENQTQTIVSAVDYIFKLIGDINENYHYQLVEDVNNVEYCGKSSITFSTGALKNANGCAVRENSFFSFGSKGNFNQNCKIMYDKNFLKNNEKRLYYTTLHELLHVFGLEDVYSDAVRYLNTYMNVNTNESLTMITPNDYKILVACYAKNFSRFDEKQDYINLLLEKVEKYSSEYYQYYSHQQLENKKQGWLECGYSEEEVQQIFSYSKLGEKLSCSFDVCLTTGGERVSVLVDEGQYSLFTFDKNDVLLESCFGSAYNVNGEIYLESVHLNSFTYGKETYADMYIYLPEKSTNQHCRLYDTLNHCYSGTGVLTESAAQA